jgi:SAM-dependent methyltransferase
METKTGPNEEQAAIWNGCAGRAWVDEQALLDLTFQPFAQALAAAATAAGARRVLDVGCGSGATTLGVARAIGPAGHALGIDISEPLIALARRRATDAGSTARFLCADAQTHVFESADFDLLISRFGVMFFADTVAAFANLRRAMRPGGAMRCMVFRSAAENPFMTAAERAAAPLLPNVPPRRPDGPGQFAFADAPRVTRLLEAAGWTDIELTPIDVPCAFPEAELTRYITRLGPVGLVLRDAEESTRQRVIATIRAAFAPFIIGGEVRFIAACWSIGASA